MTFRGICLKSHGEWRRWLYLKEIITVVKNTIKGLQVIHHNVYDKVRKQINVNKLESSPSPANIELSERDIKIIRFIIQGKSNKEIGSNLFISETRVKFLITKILHKFNLKDRTQLVVCAMKYNIIKDIMD